MSRMGRLFSIGLDRRGVCSLIAGWAVSVIFAKLPYAAEPSLPSAKTDHEFLAVNGWVLTREDIAGSRMMNHVVEL
jgi:hypothetical protein